ncbi:hypothetical protein HDU98_009058, partial [Podochytrium sp. JEL0797]
KHAELMAQSTGTSTLNNNVISKIVGTMWKQEPAEVKAIYAAKAQEEKRVHMLKHPDYKYKPKKSQPKMPGSSGAAASVRYNPMMGSRSDSGPKSKTVQRQGSVGSSSSSRPAPVNLAPRLGSSQPQQASGPMGGMGMSLGMLEEYYCPSSQAMLPSVDYSMMPPEMWVQQAMNVPQLMEYPGVFDQQWTNGLESNGGFAMPIYWGPAVPFQQAGSPPKYQFDNSSSQQ